MGPRLRRWSGRLGALVRRRSFGRRPGARPANPGRDSELASAYGRRADVIFCLKVEGGERYRFISVNDAFLRATGLEESQVVGRLASEVIPESSYALVAGKYREAIDSRGSVFWEETTPYPSGLKTGEVSVAPLFSDLGACTHLVGTVHDVTERKQAERAHAQLEAVFQSLNDGVVVTDVSGEAVLFNEAAVRLFGYAGGDEMRRQFRRRAEDFELSTIDGLVLGREEFPSARVLRGETLAGLELRVRRRDGSLDRLVSFSGAPVHVNGSVATAVLVARDMSARQAAEQQIRRANALLERRVSERTEQLRRTIDELESFTYTIAHDLRAPLLSVHRHAALLMRRLAFSAPEDVESLGGVAAAAKRMDRLIGDLLVYSRIGRGEVKLEALDVGDVFKEALSALSGVIGERGARVTARADGAPRVLADRFLLIQALTNLLDNALKFVPPERVPEIELGARRERDRLRIWVRDNGVGLDPHYGRSMFKVFERLNGRERYPGTGIGLAIVSKAVDRLGGRVGFEPSSRGTLFWLELGGGAL